jgi:hypothetical protein
MQIQRSLAIPLYISFLTILVIGVISPVLNPVSAAKELELSDNSSIQPVNVEHALVNRMPTLQYFIRVVQNGASDELVGVYVPGVLALRIIQQPVGNSGYVSPEQGAATLFGLAENYGVIGLLAHNYLAGSDFNKLLPKMRVNMIYGNGRIDHFSITDIKYYRALQPNSPYSNFEDLENLGVLITAEELFNQIYKSSDRVVFQTCVSANGEASWGRLFVTAKQVSIASTSLTHSKWATNIRAH